MARATQLPSSLIFLVTNNQDIAMKYSGILMDYMNKPTFQQYTKGRDATIIPAGIDEMRNILQSQQGASVKIPNFIKHAQRKLFVAFDTEGNDFLEDLKEAIDADYEANIQSQKQNLIPLSAADGLATLCKQHFCTKVWIQKPPVDRMIDADLGERLADYGLEICQISPRAERNAKAAANRVAYVYKTEGVGKSFIQVKTNFWKTLRPEFERVGVQAALLNTAAPLASDPVATTAGVTTFDVLQTYLELILTWIGQG